MRILPDCTSILHLSASSLSSAIWFSWERMIASAAPSLSSCSNIRLIAELFNNSYESFVHRQITSRHVH
eukprot:761539-Hanusia_phi.AAC.1